MTVSRLFPNKMAVTMALFWVSLVLSVIGCSAKGEFNVLYSPNSLKFSGTSKTQETLLKEVFSAALGLSVEENSEWGGLYVSDPFNTPEAVVEVYVDGVPSLGESAKLKSKTFELTVDEYEPNTYNEIKHRINQRFTNGDSKIINVQLSNPDELTTPNFEKIFGVVNVPKTSKQSVSHLKYSVEEDRQFLRELETLKAITARVASGAITADNVIDFYNFRFRSLHALSDFHGASSLETKEAKKLLAEALNELSDAFVKAYDGAVLVTAVITDVVHTRRVRATENETPAATTQDTEMADDEYDGDYPAIFNILLWFGIVFVFTLVSIVYAIMDMDPGRDSIIYRMTSTRMKKDN